MEGIVLLDDAQARALSRQDTPGFQQSTSSMRRRQPSDSHTTVSNTSSTDFQSVATLGGSSGKPSIATLGSPRTNFASREGPLSRRGPPPRIETQIPHQDDDSPDPWMYDELHHGDSLDSSARGLQESHELSIKLILAGVAVGFVLGIILQAVKVSPLVAKWIGFPCQLFLRALSCVVLPYVFCSVAVAIGDIVYVGKISAVGYHTAKIFVTFWIATCIMGLGIAILFRPMFHPSKTTVVHPANAFGIHCANNQLMTLLSNGSVVCSTNPNTTASLSDSQFTITDVNSMFATTNKVTGAQTSLGELLRAIALYAVTPNLTNSFINRELLAIIICAMFLGAIAGRNYFSKTRRVNYLYLSLVQLRDALLLMLDWVIALTPLALISFIASFIATDLAAFHATEVFYYILAMLTAATIQMFVIYPAIVLFATQCNPFNHMKQMTRAYLFGFACSSSLATAPLTLSCIKRARVCSQSLSNFVVSIGVCSNTSACGFYTPIAVIFLNASSGSEADYDTSLSFFRLSGLFVLSLVASFGTPPIPSGALVIVQAIYSSLFNVSTMPPGFTYLLAVDFIVDRIATVCNVNDDIMAVKIIAENTDETVVSEHLGERH